MSIIGIDTGITFIKIIEYKNGKINNKFIKENGDINEDLEYFLKISKINIQEIEQIVITGINSKLFNKKLYKNIKVMIVNEFIAIGKGALTLTKKKEALIVSVGTGTAFVKAGPKNKIEHIGGTGIGGGTLINLCSKFCNINSFDEIIKLSEKGNLKNINLTIGDVCKTKVEGLPQNITASNFGKLNKNKQIKKEDICLGIINMIFETIAMMAVFAIRKEKIKEVIITGNVVSLPQVKKILKEVEKIQNVKFIIPKNKKYSTALGAVEYFNSLN